MKTYLNKGEKDTVLVLETFVDFLERHIVELEKLKRPKKIIGFAKMSKTFCYKVLDWYLEGLDQNYLRQLVKEQKKMEVVTKYRNEAIKEYEQMKLLDDNVVINSNDLDLIVEHSLVICMKCTMCGEKARNCKLRDVYIRNDIAVFNTEAGFNQCPYRPESEFEKDVSIDINHGL